MMEGLGALRGVVAGFALLPHSAAAPRNASRQRSLLWRQIDTDRTDLDGRANRQLKCLSTWLSVLSLGKAQRLQERHQVVLPIFLSCIFITTEHEIAQLRNLKSIWNQGFGRGVQSIGRTLASASRYRELPDA
jgi:hypothetical protein